MRPGWFLMLPAAAMAMMPLGCMGEGNWPGRPDAAAAHLERGAALVRQGRLDAAKAELTEAIKANPNSPEAHACLGDVYRREKEYSKARDRYVESVRLDPYAFRPHYNLAVTYQLMAAQAAMVEQARKLLREAVQVYLRATTIRPDDFEANLNLSACYHQLGRQEQAEQHCRKALELRPDSAAGWCNLGIICDAQGKTNEAVHAFKRSLEYDTNQPRVLLSLGACHKRSDTPGHVKAALHAFQLALRIDPLCAEAHEQIGLIHFETGDNAEALLAFEKAVAIDAESSVAHRGIGAVHILRYISDPTDAAARTRGLAAWKRSLEIDPDQPKLAELVVRYQTPRPAPVPVIPAPVPAIPAPVQVLPRPASQPATAPATRPAP